MAIFTNGEIKASLGCMRPSLKAGKEKLSPFEQVSCHLPGFSTFAAMQKDTRASVAVCMSQRSQV